MRTSFMLRRLMWIGALSLAAVALGADSGTRVSIKLAKASGDLPDPEKLVEALNALGGGERQVRVKRTGTEIASEVEVDLWGPTVPAKEIPATLRDAFPVLAKADIRVSTLDPGERPKVEDAGDVTTTTTQDGKVRKIITKKIVETK